MPDPEAPIVFCDVRALRFVDAATVEALARLALDARRLGCQLRIEHASRELRELIGFMGLDEILDASADSGAGSGSSGGACTGWIRCLTADGSAVVHAPGG